MKLKTLLLLALLVPAVSPVAVAQANELDATLNETVQMVQKKGFFTFDLETTFYKPDGDGPFPIAVINHGKAAGDPRFQGRYRPTHAVRYFLKRGYAVVVPMRQGFSKSTGSYIGGGCNVESNGRVQAEDVQAVLDYVVTQPWADKDRIVVLGQSHGGWTTLAFGAQNYPGVKALVNFAGGLRQESCANWEGGLARGAQNYAKTTKLPSLWFYGANDSYFNTETSRAMYERYTAADGQARLIEFGKFGADSHSMFGSRAGLPIWEPEVSKLLASVGLPSEPKANARKYDPVSLTPTPAKTDFAPLEDESKIPYLKDTGRAGYKTYLTKSIPRAFAIAPNGAWGYAEGGDDPLQRALANCNKFSKSECRLYSVDDFVVWKAD